MDHGIEYQKLNQPGRWLDEPGIIMPARTPKQGEKERLRDPNQTKRLKVPAALNKYRYEPEWVYLIRYDLLLTNRIGPREDA